MTGPSRKKFLAAPLP